MKNRRVFINQQMIVLNMMFVLVFLTSLPSPAQTAKEIIDKHIKAIGGKAKLDAITSYSFNLSENTVTYKKPGKWIIVNKDSGKVISTKIFHDEKGWLKSNNGNIVTTNSGMDFEHFLPGLLAYATATKYKIENLGPDDGGYLRIKIKSLTNNFTEKAYTFYIDPATYLIYQIEEYSIIINYHIVLADYKTINGITMPMTIRKKSEYSENYYSSTKTNVKLNIPVEDKLFFIPESK